ncbi:MAG: hypothetical protein ACAH88_01570, partial [Roseimicrobium sp.]
EEPTSRLRILAGGGLDVLTIDLDDRAGGSNNDLTAVLELNGGDGDDTVTLDACRLASLQLIDFKTISDSSIASEFLFQTPNGDNQIQLSRDVPSGKLKVESLNSSFDAFLVSDQTARIKLMGGKGDDTFTFGGILTLQSSLTLTGGDGRDSITFAYDLYLPGNTLTADAETITVAANKTISTRQVAVIGDHLSGASTGLSGSILFEPTTAGGERPNGLRENHIETITINTGAKLLAQGSGAFAAGNITLKAGVLGYADDWTIRLINAEAKVIVNSATIKGGQVEIRAVARATQRTSFLPESLDFIPASLAGTLLGAFIGLPAAASVSNATATVELNGTTVINAAGLTVGATAHANASAMVFVAGLGVVYLESNPEATITVQSGVTITTTGDASFSSKAVSILSGTAVVLKLSRSDGFPVNVALAIAKSNAESKTHLQLGSTITSGGSVSVSSETVWNHALAATAGSFRNGVVGIAVTVSLFDSRADAWADGSITANGNINVTADSRVFTYAKDGVDFSGWNSANYGRNMFVSSGAAGSGGIANKILKGVWAVSAPMRAVRNLWINAIKAKLGAMDSTNGIAGSITYGEQTHITTARIGDSATSTAAAGNHAVVKSITGNVTVTATTTDTPQSSAIAGVDYSNAPGEVKKKALAIGITIADLTYDSQAYFG